MKGIPARVLVIAGSDSSGGAGLLRDARVFADFGVDVSCAVTAVTAQTHHGVAASYVLSAELVRQQIQAALDAAPVNAIKIGMLGNAPVVAAVVETLPDHPSVPIVLDPVLASSSGTRLLDNQGLRLLKERLLSRCTLITPNLAEAAALLEATPASSAAEMVAQANDLLRLGSPHVLLKGGHAGGDESVDVLATSGEVPTLLRARRVDATLRGTGCALSSAIAAMLAVGESVTSACRRGKEYVWVKLLAEQTAALTATRLPG